MNMGIEVIKKYFPALSKDQEKQFLAMSVLYSFWNEQINVISRKDLDELYLRHVLHSLAIAKFISFKPSSRILDIGTGGGFPGIPLAILFPETSFTLVDSIGKKIKVVTEVVQSLGLQNVKAIHDRSENIAGTFDFILTRAVGRSKVIHDWSKHQVAPQHNHDMNNGLICLKGGDLSEELKELNRTTEIKNISEYFDEDFFETKQIVYIPFK